MIGHLKGIILTRKAPNLLLEVNGVGYEIQAPMTTFYHLPTVGEQTALFTHLAVREDCWSLYGFHRAIDRDLFRLLIRVNGIGPKVGLSLLSGMEPAQLIQAIRDNRITDLTTIPGIGKKTAERLIVETREKLSQWETGNTAQSSNESPTGSTSQPDAIQALAALGYKPAEAKRAVSAVITSANTTEDCIRLALQYIVKGVHHA